MDRSLVLALSAVDGGVNSLAGLAAKAVELLAMAGAADDWSAGVVDDGADVPVPEVADLETEGLRVGGEELEVESFVGAASLPAEDGTCCCCCLVGEAERSSLVRFFLRKPREGMCVEGVARG